jgi:hypothetical protein
MEYFIARMALEAIYSKPNISQQLRHLRHEEVNHLGTFI